MLKVGNPRAAHGRKLLEHGVGRLTVIGHRPRDDPEVEQFGVPRRTCQRAPAITKRLRKSSADEIGPDRLDILDRHLPHLDFLEMAPGTRPVFRVIADTFQQSARLCGFALFELVEPKKETRSGVARVEFEDPFEIGNRRREVPLPRLDFGDAEEALFHARFPGGQRKGGRPDRETQQQSA